MTELPDEKVDKIRKILFGTEYLEVETKVKELLDGLEALRQETRADRISFERRIDFMQNDFPSRISHQSHSIFSEKLELEQRADRLAHEVKKLANIVADEQRSRSALAESVAILAQNLKANSGGGER